MPEAPAAVYKKADLGAAKSLKDAVAFAKTKFIEFAVGTRGYRANYIWIAPPHINMSSFFEALWVHFNINGRTIGCPKKMFNKDCPVCDAAWYMHENGHKEEAKPLFAKPNYLLNVFKLDKNDDDTFTISDETCFVMGCGAQLFDLLWDECEPDSAGIPTVDLSDPDAGYVINIKAKQSDKKFRGKTVSDYKVTKVVPAQAFPGNMALLNDIHDLTEFTSFLEPDEAMALLEGGAADSSGDPWATPQEQLTESVVDGEFREVPEEDEDEEEEGPTPTQDDASEDEEDETEAVAEAVAEAAVKAVKKPKAAAKPAAPAPQQEDDPAPTSAVGDLKSFLANRKPSK